MANFSRNKLGVNLVAMCSQEKIKVDINSICIDLDEMIFKSRESEILLMRKMILEKDKYIKSLRNHIKKLDQSNSLIRTDRIQLMIYKIIKRSNVRIYKGLSFKIFFYK